MRKTREDYIWRITVRSGWIKNAIKMKDALRQGLKWNSGFFVLEDGIMIKILEIIIKTLIYDSWNFWIPNSQKTREGAMFKYQIGMQWKILKYHDSVTILSKKSIVNKKNLDYGTSFSHNMYNVLTCCDVFRCSIAICSHDAGSDMRIPTWRPQFR